MHNLQQQRKKKERSTTSLVVVGKHGNKREKTTTAERLKEKRTRVSVLLLDTHFFLYRSTKAPLTSTVSVVFNSQPAPFPEHPFGQPLPLFAFDA